MAQKAGQKRKVIEVPRLESDSDEGDLGDVQLNGEFDGEESSEDGSEAELDDDDEEEEDEEEEDEEEEEEDLNNGETPSSDDEEDMRQQLRALNTNGRAATAQEKLMGSDTGRELSTISPDTKVKPSAHGEERSNFRIEEDANGNERYVYGEIEPNYDSDDSDAPATSNTIGNIPLSYYDAYPHIGYDINGRKLARPAKGQALDSLLDSIDVPEGWTGLTDPTTGKPLVLNAEELETLKKLTRNEQPGDGYDPYPEYVEWFTGKHREEIMPLSAAPEPKRRFVPSMHEHKRVMKMVKAIKEGRIKPFREPTEEEREREEAEREYASYDIWSNEVGRPDHIMNIPAPKLPPPGYEESYHPPPEYLPDKHEQKEWEEQDPEDRTKDFLPRDHAALRKVPGWGNFVSERMNRCLDLYLAPRVRRSKLNIDPESLLPKLPDPSELKPFPTFNDTTYLGHEGRVRCTAIDPAGRFIASGSDDGTVRLWSFGTGRQERRIKLSPSDAVNVVAWRPIRNTRPGMNGPIEACVLAACCGDVVYFIIPPTTEISGAVEQASQDILDAGFGFAATNESSASTKVNKLSPASWSRPSKALQDKGIFLTLTLRHTPKTLVWHRRGEYFATVCPDATSERSKAVAIHTLSKHTTQHPFRKLKGFAQTATFHPSRPLFFVATRQRIRIYDLQQQKLEKELQPGARYISSISLHPLGNNLLVSSYDKRLLWHDLDLGSTPYKTLRYHQKAIRQVKFHPTLPLFADASDDGTVQIFHGKVLGDSMENATVVPLKVLRGHKVKNDIGVMDLEWHPTEAWLVTSGADGTVRLWT